MDLVGHLECGMASLRGLEVGDVRWQPVPVTDGPRIKKRTCMRHLLPAAGVNAGTYTQ